MGSVITRKTKGKWFLATTDLYIGEPPYIDWTSLLPKSAGSKHQRSYLMKSVQGLISALADLPRTNTSSWIVTGQPAHATVQNWFFTIRLFVRWMIARGVWRFSQLTPNDVADLLNDFTQRLDGAGPVAIATWHQRSRVLQDMWNLRMQYIGPLRVDPAKLTITSSRRFRHSSSWKALDENIVLPLVLSATQWIEKYGPLVEETLHRYWKFRSQEVGMTFCEANNRITKWYTGLSHDPRWIELRVLLDMPDASMFQLVRRAYAMSKGASANIILFTVGMRASELCRLDWDCVRVEVDALGNQVTRLHGVAAKQGGRHRYWIACDQVVRAIDHIKSITNPARKMTKNKGLWICGAGDTFLRPGCRIGRMGHAGLCRVMKVFANWHLRPLNIKTLHPHMARKSFAQFVVRRDKNALGPLAQHYGHVRRAVTDGSYVGTDLALAALLEQEGRKDLAQGLMDLISSEAIAGRAGVAMAKVREEMSKLRGKKALKRFVEKLIVDGVQLAPCDWGYCVYSKFFSACKGDDHGPNEALRSPDICSSCANFGVTETHLPWWEKRLARDDEFLAHPGLSDQTRAVVRARRLNSASILLRLVRGDEYSNARHS